MSLKQEIETWVTALGQYDNHQFEEALRTFDGISDTSKILFNCGMIHATLGQHESAVECFQRAIKRDNYLAVAYFQQGVSNFLTGDFEEALANFNDTLLYLRGNRYIDYEQLGLKYKLYSCEVLFNRGLCYVYLKQKETGMSDLRYASQEKQTADHDVIDEAIQEGAEEFTVFSIGVGIIYRPNSAKVKNLKTKDYLGKARIIATSDNSHITGSDAKKAALQAASGRSPQDRLPESISFAAANLVRPNLNSRSRQQSEPPILRNVFPPTPPPENENDRLNLAAKSNTSVNNPVEQVPLRIDTFITSANQPFRPEPLKLSQSSFTSLEQKEGPRIGTSRTASEPRGPSHRDPARRDRQQSRRLFMETTPISPGDAGRDGDIDEIPEEEEDQAKDDILHPLHRRRRPSIDTGVVSSTSNPRSHRLPSSQQRSNRSRSRGAVIQRRTQYSIDEETPSTAGATSITSSMEDYEVLHNAGGNLSRSPPPMTNHKGAYRPRAQSERPVPGTESRANPRARSRSRQYRPPSNRRTYHQADIAGLVPDLKSIRIKCHHAHNNDDDTRFIMLPPTVPFATFVEKVCDKYKLPAATASATGTAPFKIKVRDEEGDLITVGDSEDWDMALATARQEYYDEEGAALATSPSTAEEYRGSCVGGSSTSAEGGMGRMEVWIM